MKSLYKIDNSREDYYIYQYDVSNEGKYKIYQDYLNLDSIYINASNQSMEGDIQLNQGINEVALLINKAQSEERVYYKDEIKFGDYDVFENQISLPSKPALLRIEFDYRFEEGNYIQIYGRQNIDDILSPIYKTAVVKDKYYHDSNTWVGEFRTTQGASDIVISFEPVIQKDCQAKYWFFKGVCETKIEPFVVEIKNFTITKVTIPEIFFYREIPGASSGNNSSVVDFEKINPTSYTVKVSKHDDSPEILVFSELFNNGWQARIDDGELLQTHLLANGYANAWKLERSGEYNIYLSYKPQRLLNLAKLVSLISFIVMFLGLILLRWRRKEF